MLNKKPEMRPTALECIANPWIQRFNHLLSTTSDPVVSSLSLMGAQVSTNCLKSALMHFIIHRVIPGSEIAKISEVFTALDHNGDGTISPEELFESFKSSMGEEEAKTETDKVLAVADRDGDGQIEYTEFLLRAFDEKELLSKENLRVAFNTLDKDGSGSVSVQELKNFFRINGSPGSLEQWQILISEFDSSGDGEIDFKEFRGLMKKAIRKR